MEKCIQDELIRSLRELYQALEQPLLPTYIRYVKENCQDDFQKLASNWRFREYILTMRPIPNRFLEFKRSYHRLLIDAYLNAR